jgi:hypothetical protein
MKVTGRILYPRRAACVAPTHDESRSATVYRGGGFFVMDLKFEISNLSSEVGGADAGRSGKNKAIIGRKSRFGIEKRGCFTLDSGKTKPMKWSISQYIKAAAQLSCGILQNEANAS